MVHNHGTEDGPGLACEEIRLPDNSLRGACIITPVEKMSVILEKQAWLKKTMEQHINTTTNIIREFRTLSREFNEVSREALQEAAKLPKKTEFGPIGIPVRIGNVTQHVSGHATFWKLEDGTVELCVTADEHSRALFERFFSEWIPLDLIFCASPVMPRLAPGVLDEIKNSESTPDPI